MFDVELFIQSIRARPALWRHKREKDRSWGEIGEIMYKKTWSRMESPERKKKVKEMTKKWGNLKDTFFKWIKVGAQKKKYVFADDLEFLLQTEAMDEKAQKRERSKSDCSDEDHVEKKPRTESKAIQTTTESFKQKEEDPDKSYFMSLLPIYKRLKEDEKNDLRPLILQMLQKGQQQFVIDSDMQAPGETLPVDSSPEKLFPALETASQASPPAEPALGRPASPALPSLAPSPSPSFPEQSSPASSAPSSPESPVLLPPPSSEYSPQSSTLQYDTESQGCLLDALQQQFFGCR